LSKSKKTKEQRQIEGAEKLNKLIDSAMAGEVICQVTESVKDKLAQNRDDVSFMKARYTGSLPVEERIDMYNVVKKIGRIGLNL
jgi:hypothetical protein